MMRRLREDRSGVAAIEFAIVAPLFIVMLLAILLFGMFFTIAQSVQQIAAESARASLAGLSEQERDALASARVAAEVSRYPFLLAEHISVATGPQADDPDLFRVVVTYDASHLGLAAFSALLPVPADRISRVAVIRRGGW